MYQLPGIGRKIIKNGPNETKFYEGIFDGSGQAITSVKLFVDSLKQNDLTYSSVIEKIESGEWEAIYDNKTQSASPNSVKSDTNIGSDSLTYHKVKEKQSKEDIEIFLYGKENNKTGYTRIKPKAEDIGKKGFIYIFAQ